MDCFHRFNYRLILGVLVFVSRLFIFLIIRKNFFKSGKIEYQFGELLCRIFPTLILLVQMVPSLSLLYYYGLINVDAQLRVKVIGHQWYWSYDYSDVEGLEFDSYIKSLDILELGDSRLLDVDNRCVLPNNLNIRFCVTSADVIHAWALSRLAVKLDAMSGIISVLNYNFPLVGVFYGQCSEICGANHSFIPIVVEVTLFDFFKNWCFLILD
jgi:cytochrome c oxidase subunit 2